MVAGAGWHCAGVVYFVDGVEGMSTAPVMSVTDELLAVLDAKTENFVGFVIRSDTVARLVTELRRLRAENAELAKDAARLQFVIDEEITISKMNGTGTPMVYQCQWHDCRQTEWYSSLAEAIDTAMFDTAMAAQ